MWRLHLQPPEDLGGAFLVHDDGDKVPVIPDSPVPTIRIAFHTEHRFLLLRLGQRAVAHHLLSHDAVSWPKRDALALRYDRHEPRMVL